MLSSLSLWTETGNQVGQETNVSFTISVQQQNLAHLKAEALAVSTPGSGKYGQYMSKVQIKELTAPRQADITTVTRWLESNTVSYTISDELISARTTVQHAKSLLATDFVEITHPDHGKKVISGEYTLPSDVSDAVAGVFGLRGLPLPKVEALSAPNPFGSPAKVTPTVIGSTYNVKGVDVQRGSGNTQAVAEFQGQLMSEKDLSDFFTHEVPKAQQGDDKVSKFVGYTYHLGEGVEALLDVEFIMGVAPGVSTEFWEWKSSDFCADLLAFTHNLLASEVSVMSISYGWQGDLKRLNCQNNEVDTIDSNWAKLAAKGVSVLISSGDSGSGYTRKASGRGYELYPSWPASSPWVTAVGATRFEGHIIGNEEMASDQFGSGGGFSTRFNTSDAPWQQDATAKYIAQGSSLPKFPPASEFPASGRGTPDVSALGEGYQVYVKGRIEAVGGTSASCPAFAGMVSLLNDARKQAGKPAMGFLNPFLYKNADAFNDITMGTNAIGRGTGPVAIGYAAAPGWDPATGLGTPIFSKLLTAAMA